MKKLFTLMLTLCLVSVMFLTGCVNEGMADKINKKADSDKGYSYTSLIEDYGTPTIGYVDPEKVPFYTGIVIYVNGCENAEEVAEKVDEGKKLKAVYVSIALNVVVNATFKEYNTEEE